MKRLMRSMSSWRAGAARRLSPLGLALLCCLVAHGCSIDPYKASFSCKHGEACAPGLHCDPQLLRCVERVSTSATVLPGMDAGDTGGRDAHRGDAGTIDAGRTDAESGDAGQPEAARNARACEETCGPETPICLEGRCVACQPPQATCDGARPKTCSSEYRWELHDPCESVCNNGVCSDFHLTGGMVTVSGAVLSADGVRLIDHGLSGLPTSCGDTDGTRLCVTGGVHN